MQNKGWVRLWREQFTHGISDRKPWCDGYAWAYLYSQANYKPGVANFRNQYIPVERGQFITSILKLSKTFGWTRKRTRAFLVSLENQEMIQCKSGTKLDEKLGTNWDQKGSTRKYTRRDSRFSVISICNYEKFQPTEGAEGTTEDTVEGTAEAQQENTIKEFNNNIEINNKHSSTQFDLFWKAYPKKKSKGQAEKAFQGISPDEQLLNRILVSIEQAKKSEAWLRDEGRFIPYPATWLNARGWDDEYPDQSLPGEKPPPLKVVNRDGSVSEVNL